MTAFCTPSAVVEKHKSFEDPKENDFGREQYRSIAEPDEDVQVTEAL